MAAPHSAPARFRHHDPSGIGPARPCGDRVSCYPDQPLAVVLQKSHRSERRSEQQLEQIDLGSSALPEETCNLCNGNTTSNLQFFRGLNGSKDILDMKS